MANQAPPLVLIVGIGFVVLGLYLISNDLKLPAQIPIIQLVNNPFEVVYNGSEAGVSLGTIQKGQTITVTYLGGKIISNTKTSWSSPIWGTPQSKTDLYWVKGLPYKEMNTDAVFLELNGNRTSFRKDGNSVSITASSTGEARLRMNDSQYFDNAGDARFQVIVNSPPSAFTPRKTTPQGAMLGDGSNGLYYANPTNSLERGGSL